MMSLRIRYVSITLISLALVLLTTYSLRVYIPSTKPIFTEIDDTIIKTPPPETPPPKIPIYKPISAPALPIKDNFPLAGLAHSSAELPPIPTWNAPPKPHVPENTALFIGFTRNWRVLQQVVVSYITAGWPAEDIYVVENTGVMDSNALGLLTLQNPFFLNHTRLDMLGVNILVTPTLFTFAQLQNFYIFTAQEKGWDYYFWSHMDVVALSFEDPTTFPTELSPLSLSNTSSIKPQSHSIYAYCVAALREVLSPDPVTGQVLNWAMRFFSYDRLALVNLSAFKSIGAWDTLIPFYMTDCDMHARLEMAGYDIQERQAGMVYDVGGSLEDLTVLYRKTRYDNGEGEMMEVKEPEFKDPNVIEEMASFEAREEKMLEQEEGLNARRPDNVLVLPGRASAQDGTHWREDDRNSPRWAQLTGTLDRMQNSKNSGARHRNSWQSRQEGGQGEPFYRDSAGFEKGIELTIEHGRNVFREKWGHRDCDIVAVGYTAGDAWRVEHDWE